MRSVAPEYLKLLWSLNIHVNDPEISFFSSVTCKSIQRGQELGSDYWVKNLVSPVKFDTAVGEVLSTISAQKLFVEIGPHSALAGPIRQILQHHGSTDEYVHSCRRGGDSRRDILKLVGELWLRDVGVDMQIIFETGKFLPDLPLYPWHYDEPLWLESRLSKEWRLREFPHHDILGSRVLESTDQSPSWRNILRLDVVPWIKEH